MSDDEIERLNTIIKVLEAQVRMQVTTIAELDEALIGMVGQHCGYHGGLDSMALHDNADAMRLLARRGKLKIETDRGRRVIGQWNPPPEGTST